MKAYFQDRNLNYAPLVEVVVYNPLKTRSVSLKLMIDTGFQGGVLLPLQAYLNLQLNLMEEVEAIAVTATGIEVKLRVAKAIIELGGKKIKCRAYTTLGVKRSLLGREVLKQAGLLYNPPRELKLPIKWKT